MHVPHLSFSFSPMATPRHIDLRNPQTEKQQKTTVPPLRLTFTSVVSPSSRPLTALPSTSISSKTVRDDIIRCPKCTHRRGVIDFAYWKERKEMVYRCTHYSHHRHGRWIKGDGTKHPISPGDGLCTYTWIQSQREPTCYMCLSTMVVESRFEVLGHACKNCKTFVIARDE